MTTKELIFHEALLLIARKGYEATSIRDICKMVGIRESSFYNHFFNKQALLDEIFNVAEHIITEPGSLQKTTYLLIEDASLREFFHFRIDRYIQYWEEPRNNLIRLIVVQEQTKIKRAAEILLTEITQRTKSLEKYLDILSRKGKIRPGPLRPVAMVFIHTIHSLHQNYYVSKLFDHDSGLFLKEMHDAADHLAGIYEL